jgi:hypothetical protein
MNDTVFGRMAFPTRDDPAVFKPRRFSDPVSPLNDGIHDETRLLLAAVELVDGLGLKIIAVDADRGRNKRILVSYSRECDALEGVEVARQAGASHWAANRFGTEIRWVIPMEAA